MRTLVSLTNQGMGFDSARVLVAQVDLRRTGIAAGARALPFYEQIRQAVAAVPGVEAAGASFTTPVSGSTWQLRVNIPGFDGAGVAALDAVQRR